MNIKKINSGIAVMTAAILIFCSGCFVLGRGPGKAHHDVPVTYSLGWWNHNDEVTIEAFEVKVVKSELNLFNADSKISYTITGTITSINNWEPHIGKIHISERMTASDSLKKLPVIELTPVVYLVHNENYKATPVKFSVTNEHILHSYQWGKNTFRFICRDKQQDIELFQNK